MSLLPPLALCLLVVAACGEGEAPAKSGPFDPAMRAVCGSAAAAIAGDVTGAHTLFVDRAHQRLHELAAAVEKPDRQVAGRLLEASARTDLRA